MFLTNLSIGRTVFAVCSLYNWWIFYAQYYINAKILNNWGRLLLSLHLPLSSPRTICLQDLPEKEFSSTTQRSEEQTYFQYWSPKSYRCTWTRRTLRINFITQKIILLKDCTLNRWYHSSYSKVKRIIWNRSVLQKEDVH